MTNRTSISDEQLIQFFLNGDQKALSTLIELYKYRIYTSIYGMVQDKNKAEDIFYVVFVHIIDNMIAGKAPEGGKFLPWAMKVAHGLCIQYNSTLVKTESHVEEFENEEQEWNDSEIPLKSAKGYTHKKHGRIRILIDKLPDQQREVVFLSHYSGMSFKEIAALLNCSVTNALEIMHSALVNLGNLIVEKKVCY